MLEYRAIHITLHILTSTHVRIQFHTETLDSDISTMVE